MLRARLAVTALLVGCLGAAVVLGAALERSARAALAALTSDDPARVLPAGVTLLAVLGLATALGWLLLCVAVCSRDALARVRQGHPGGVEPAAAAGRRRLRPVAVRVLVAAVVGTALGGPAASAAPPPVTAASAPVPGAPPSVAGLQVPDRTVDGPASARTHLVRPGDTLWHVAAGLLPPTADAGAVDRGWRLLYARNRARVGPDPDLLLPGTVLRVPPREALTTTALSHPPRHVPATTPAEELR